MADLAALRQMRLQYFCWLLGGALNTFPQWQHVSWFRVAVRCLRPLSKDDRPAHARHRGAGLSALTCSCFPQVAQVRVRIALGLALTGAALFGGFDSGSPQSGGLQTPAVRLDSVKGPAATGCVRCQRFVLLWFSAGRGWMPARGGFPKIRPCRWRCPALRPPVYVSGQEGPANALCDRLAHLANLPVTYRPDRKSVWKKIVRRPKHQSAGSSARARSMTCCMESRGLIRRLFRRWEIRQSP